MKHTPEEIINALQVIQEECRSYTADCSDCPFHTGNECKFVAEEEPMDWRFNKTDWKAFED